MSKKAKLFERKLNVPKVRKAIEAYFALCKQNNKMPMWVEFAISLDVTDETLNRYLKMEDYAPLLEKVKKAEEAGLNRKLIDENKPVGSIFLLKARHGYKEAQDVNINVKGDFGVVMLPSKDTKRASTKGAGEGK